MTVSSLTRAIVSMAMPSGLLASRRRPRRSTWTPVAVDLRRIQP